MPRVKTTASAFFVLIAAAVLLFGFWLRVHRLADLPPGLSPDEAGNAVDGLQISQSGNFPQFEDFGRPEPLYTVFLALGSLFFGPHVFTFRLVSAFIGLVTIAAACWTMRQCLYDFPPSQRWIIGLTAAAALAVCLSHVVLSRALYRTILQPLFMLTFVGFSLRGLRTLHRRDFILSGASLGILLYTYTASLAVPASLIALIGGLLIFRRSSWRRWLPNLLILGLFFAIFIAPIVVEFVQNPQSILGRAREVSTDVSAPLADRITRVIGQFYQRGDPNPQYNVGSVPLLPPTFRWLFVIGLLALLIRIKQPSSWLIAALLVLATVPSLATNEIPHGLRIVGEFAVLPLVIGLGAALMIGLFRHIRFRQIGYIAVAALVFLMTVNDGSWASQTYINYWADVPSIRMYDRQFSTTDWFFRTDRRDLGLWLASQPGPLLVPLGEAGESTTRAWMMAAYPDVNAHETPQFPPGTRLVVPWQLETDNLKLETRNYVLLDHGVIYLLPPLSVESHAALLANIDQAQAIRRANGDLIARVVPVMQPITFDQPRNIMLVNGHSFGDELWLSDWYGPDRLNPGDKQLSYTLEWTTNRRLGNYYNAFLQLQTQDSQKVTGDDTPILRWLYSTTLWKPTVPLERVPDVHMLTVPPGLAPGAYKLVTGVYAYAREPLPYIGPENGPVNKFLTIGWLKVPQPTAPAIPADAVPQDATLLSGDVALRAASAEYLSDRRLHVSLFWQSMLWQPPFDATIFVHLTDAQGKIAAQHDARPWGGQYPTFIWGQGEIVQTDYTFDLKNVPNNGDLNVEVGMYTFPDLKRLPVTQNGAVSPDSAIHLGKLSALLAGVF